MRHIVNFTSATPLVATCYVRSFSKMIRSYVVCEWGYTKPVKCRANVTLFAKINSVSFVKNAERGGVLLSGIILVKNLDGL